MSEKRENKRGMFIFLCILAFIIAMVFGVVSKSYRPWAKEYKVEWSDSIGKIYTDISYGEKEVNKFDLYVPSNSSKTNYGLVVYLHAGGYNRR